MRRVLLAALAVGLLLGSAALATAADAPNFTRTVDVIYGRKDGTTLTMDVFTPKKDANGAAIVIVVSGGWFSNHDAVPGAAGLYGPELLKRGYTLFAVVHGSQPRYTIPDAVADLNRAVRFIRAHAKDYKIDPDRLGITGGSAGGHLSLMQGTAGDLGDPKAKDPIDRVSSRVQAVACFFPPTDFLNYGGKGKYAFALNGTLAGFRTAIDVRKLDPMTKQYEHLSEEKEKEVAGRMSPITHVSADDPPTLIIHGDADKLVPIEQAEAIVAKLKEAKVPAELVVKKGAGHGWGGMDKDIPTLAGTFPLQFSSSAAILGHGFVSRLFRVRVPGMSRRLAPLLVAGLLLPWCTAPADDDTDPLDFFRARTTRTTPDELRRLIDGLGNNSFELRERSSEQLIRVGAPALPGLTRAAAAPDAEVRRRAEDCRLAIEIRSDGPQVRAAARLVAERRPPGAAAVLLDYLPCRADETTADALRTALVAVALRDGKPEPVLVRALTDAEPARRAAAGVALCRAGVPAQLPAIRKLLQDPDPHVRLRVGLALADLGEKEAVPVLIALLDALPRNQVAPVEELLYGMAGAKSPALAMGDSAASRRKFRDAWADWWTKEGAAASRRARETPYLDHTVVLLLDLGTMIDLDTDDRPVWKMTDLGFPLDLQVLPGERVLVTDNQGGRVVERHHDGTVLWRKDVVSPLMAQRLPDGDTFIATRSDLLEVDRAGTVVFSYVSHDGEEFMRAARLPDGDIACVVTRGTRSQSFVRLDPSGRERGRFPVHVQTYGGRIDVQPDGRVLVPSWGEDEVVEYDATGRSLRKFSVAQPIAAVRLANGNTLVTSMREQRAIEFDAAGKEVWQYRSNTRVNRAWRR